MCEVVNNLLVKLHDFFFRQLFFQFFSVLVEFFDFFFVMFDCDIYQVFAGCFFGFCAILPLVGQMDRGCLVSVFEVQVELCCCRVVAEDNSVLCDGLVVSRLGMCTI